LLSWFGTCDEDVNLPYQPFVEALRHYVAHAQDARGARARAQGRAGTPRTGAGEESRRPASAAGAEAETERYPFEAATGLRRGVEAQPVVPFSTTSTGPARPLLLPRIF
jgi:hypothetical protein